MDLAVIKRKVRNDEYVVSQHADLERLADNLTVVEIEEAILNAHYCLRSETSEV